MIYSDAVEPSSVGLVRVFTIPLLEYVVGEGRSPMFDEVKLVKQPEVEEGQPAPPVQNPWTDAVAKHMAAMRPNVLIRRGVQTEKLLRDSKPAILGTEAGDMFAWNGSGVVHLPDVFKEIVDCGGDVIVTKRVMFADLRLISNPLRAHAHWFQVHAGRVAVLVLTSDVLVQHPDLPAWAKTLEAKDLHSFKGCVLGPGDCLWLPVGSCPIWIGLPTDVNLFAERPSLAPRGKAAQTAAKANPKADACVCCEKVRNAQ